MVIHFQGRYLFAFLFALLAVLQIVDVVYTREFLMMGGQEANPFAAMIINGSGWWGLLFVKVLPCIMGMIVSFYMEKTEWWVKALVWVGVAAYIPLTIFHMNSFWMIL